MQAVKNGFIGASHLVVTTSESFSVAHLTNLQVYNYSHSHSLLNSYILYM